MEACAVCQMTLLHCCAIASAMPGRVRERSLDLLGEGDI